MVTPVNDFLNNPPPITNHPMYERIHGIKQDFKHVELLNAKKVIKEEKQKNLMLDISFYTMLGMACAGGLFVYKKSKSLLSKVFSPIIDTAKNTYTKVKKFANKIGHKKS